MLFGKAQSVVASFYLAFAFFAAFALLICTPHCALAYVDPSVVTYAVQAIAGVAIAVSAVIGVAFRRARAKLFALLGIDEDAHKSHDPHYSRLDSYDPNALNDDFELDVITNAAKHGLFETEDKVKTVDTLNLKRPNRLLLAFLAAFMAAVTLIVTAPLETVAASTADFPLTPSGYAPLLIFVAFMVALVTSIALSFTSEQRFLKWISIITALGLLMWLQAMFFNAGLPIADGNAVEWKRYDVPAFFNTIVWVFVIAMSIFLARRFSRAASSIVAAISFALLIIQGAGVFAIVTDSSLVESQKESSAVAPTEEGLYEVSANNNVIVFCLDTLDLSLIDSALEQDPESLDAFTGFTRYTNVSGSMIPTRYGVPFLLTGVWPNVGEDWNGFLARRYLDSSFIDDISRAGYSVGLYSNQLMLGTMPSEEDMNTLADKTINVHEADGFIIDPIGSVGAFLQCALYRDLPWVLKPRFWFTTNEISEATVSNGSDPAVTIYTREDATYLERLKVNRLSIEDRNATGAFRFIHLTGSHIPFEYDAHMNYVGKDNATQTDQTLGALYIVKWYLSYLKQMNLYDSATIIITADHGLWEAFGGQDLTRPSGPFLFAKPSQSHEDASRHIVLNDAPISHEDILPTIIEAIGGDTSNYAGRSVFSYVDSSEADYETILEYDSISRRYINTLSVDARKDYKTIEYQINGNVNDWSTWTPTGEVWDF